MKQRMKTYDLYRATEARNEWSEAVKTYAKIGTVQVAVSLATGSTVTINEVLKLKSTHRGLTQDEVRAGDRFGGFTVDFVEKHRMMYTLYLTREEAVE